MNILAINGSPSTNGITASLVLEGARASEVTMKFIHLAEHLEGFYVPNSSTIPWKVKELLDLVKSADALIIGTPVQWFGPSDLVTTFINFLTKLEVEENSALDGKPVAFIATCDEDGAMMAISKMAAALNHMGCLIPPYCTFFHNTSMKGESEKDWQTKDISLLGRNLVRAVQLARGQKWGYAE